VNKETVSYWGLRGDKITRNVNQIIDVRDFIGTAGYALLVLAANSNHPNRLSAPDIAAICRLRTLAAA
jgi:hypothetical protein